MMEQLDLARAKGLRVQVSLCPRGALGCTANVEIESGANWRLRRISCAQIGVGQEAQASLFGIWRRGPIAQA